MIENILAELECRFSDLLCSIMTGIDAVNLLSDKFASSDCLRPLAELCKSDMMDLQHELHNVKWLIEKKAEKPAKNNASKFRFLSDG